MLEKTSTATKWLQERPEVVNLLRKYVGSDGSAPEAREVVEESGYPFTELMTALIRFDRVASATFDLMQPAV